MEVDETNIRSTKVDKALELDIDVGNLMASDPNELQIRSLRQNPGAYLKSLARDNTQLLLNKVWTLPFERVDDVIIAKLPPPAYLLPREKPVPKVKSLTKWQAYAKEKGIVKRKKTKLVWDEIVNAWVPRFGYKRAAAEHEKDWVLEVPQNADPYEDQFEKKSEVKSERVAKNELQRLKNIARSRKVVLPSTGLVPKEKQSKNELHQAMHVAKKATASLGKFQEKLPKEKPLKGNGKKRKFEPVNQEAGIEKTKNLEVLEKILRKKPKMNLEKAVGTEIRRENHEGQDDDDRPRKGAKRGKDKVHKNSRLNKGPTGKGGFKKGPAGKGSYGKGRESVRSKPKRKGKH